jgi:hypothetical protein
MRVSVRAALVASALGLSVLFAGAAPAYAAAVFVEINPSTARVGDEVGIRASCTDNLKEATVTADPFTAVITVKPSFGFLTATVRVPETTPVGDYPVTLRCPDGQTATSTLHVVAKVEPAQGPATGGGGTAPGRSAPMLVGGGLLAIAAGLVLAVVSLRRRRLG